MLKNWRKAEGKTLAEVASLLGMAGGARTFQRIEAGEVSPDADMVARIVALTAGAVTAQDMHEIRLSWLRANRPEKLEGLEAAQ